MNLTSWGMYSIRVKTRVKILENISENPNITNQELADKLELTLKGIEWQIKKLKEQGKLERIGGSKGGYWEIVKLIGIL